MARGIIPELPTSNSSPSPTPSLRNPLPLSAAQEAQVRDIYYKNVRSQCAAEIKDFAACARNRTFSLSWACRAEQFAMNSCMIAHATRQAEDAAREEWFAGVQERRVERGQPGPGVSLFDAPDAPFDAPRPPRLTDTTNAPTNAD